MDHIDLNFMFFDRNNPDRPFSNQQLFEIRREVSRIMENAGFGASLDNGADKFANTWAMPVDDTYFIPENRLFIAFTWRAPLVHGSISHLVTDGIPHLIDFVRANYRKNVLTRLVML